MKGIPFKQFMLTYNFYENDSRLSEENNDTQIIRINLCGVGLEDEDIYDNIWFEFGMKSLFNDECQEKLIDRIFPKTILNSYVYNIRVLENGVLSISLGVENEKN